MREFRAEDAEFTEARRIDSGSAMELPQQVCSKMEEPAPIKWTGIGIGDCKINL